MTNSLFLSILVKTFSDFISFLDLLFIIKYGIHAMLAQNSLRSCEGDQFLKNKFFNWFRYNQMPLTDQITFFCSTSTHRILGYHSEFRVCDPQSGSWATGSGSDPQNIVYTPFTFSFLIKVNIIDISMLYFQIRKPAFTSKNLFRTIFKKMLRYFDTPKDWFGSTSD